MPTVEHGAGVKISVINYHGAAVTGKRLHADRNHGRGGDCGDLGSVCDSEFPPIQGAGDAGRSAFEPEARTNLAGIFVAEMSFFTERKEFGNFTDIGFAVAGPGTNRYTYRTGLGLVAGLGPNGGNLCAAVGSCDTIQTEIPAAGAISFTGSAGIATTSSAGFTATAAADLDGDSTHDGWYVNDSKQGLNAADPNDVSS